MTASAAPTVSAACAAHPMKPCATNPVKSSMEAVARESWEYWE